MIWRVWEGGGGGRKGGGGRRENEHTDQWENLLSSNCDIQLVFLRAKMGDKYGGAPHAGYATK